MPERAFNQLTDSLTGKTRKKCFIHFPLGKNRAQEVGSSQYVILDVGFSSK